MANLNINCYDITDELTIEEATKGTSYVIQIPFKVYKLLKVIDNKLYVIVDIDSLDESFIKLSYVPALHDVKYIDNSLNDYFDLYEYLGTYDVPTFDKFVFLFARELTEKEVEIINS